MRENHRDDESAVTVTREGGGTLISISCCFALTNFFSLIYFMSNVTMKCKMRSNQPNMNRMMIINWRRVRERQNESGKTKLIRVIQIGKRGRQKNRGGGDFVFHKFRNLRWLICKCVFTTWLNGYACLCRFISVFLENFTFAYIFGTHFVAKPP